MPITSAAALTSAAPTEGKHHMSDTGKDYGKDGGGSELLFALVVVCIGMGLAAYSGMLQKFCGRKESQYQRVPTNGPSTAMPLFSPSVSSCMPSQPASYPAT